MSDDNLTICGKDATYRYTWRGRDEAFVCKNHAPKIRAVAEAMGLHLQMISIDQGGPGCSQKVYR